MAKVTRGGRTTWYSLDHGCTTLGEHMDWGDGRITSKSLVQLTPGEPATALFDIPADYKEVPPSGLFPDLNGAAPSSALKGFDLQYYKRRP